jgi:hypothetical protein
MSNTANFVAYDDKGEIQLIVVCLREHASINMSANGHDRYVIAPFGVRSEACYVVNNEVVRRPIMGTTVERSILKGVLAGSTITIEGREYVGDGTDIELEFSLAGEHTVKVSLWPYVDQEFIIENPA